ncbi:hypothetical protein Q4485_04810 [Granulosicoccaceae sp. 1_MG-2023]|nr:hypothetical protein [Granulosicoccaceae sp. 1_MG-2023]
MASNPMPAPATLAVRAADPQAHDSGGLEALAAAAAGRAEALNLSLAGSPATQRLESALAATGGAAAALLTCSYAAAVRLLIRALAGPGQAVRLHGDPGAEIAAVLEELELQDQHLPGKNKTADENTSKTLEIHCDPASVPALSQDDGAVHVLLLSQVLLSELRCDTAAALIVADISGLNGAEGEPAGLILDSGRYAWTGHPACALPVAQEQGVSFADEHGRLALLQRLRYYDRPRHGTFMGAAQAAAFLQALPQRLAADGLRRERFSALRAWLAGQSELPCEVSDEAPHCALMSLRFASPAKAVLFCNALALIPCAVGARRDLSHVNIPALTSGVFYRSGAGAPGPAVVSLSVGLEAIADLSADMTQAFKALARAGEISA